MKRIMRARPNDLQGGTPTMCTYCYATLGSLVGTTLVLKAGGLAGIKAAAGVAAAKFLLFLK